MILRSRKVLNCFQFSSNLSQIFHYICMCFFQPYNPLKLQLHCIDVILLYCLLFSFSYRSLNSQTKTYVPKPPSFFFLPPLSLHVSFGLAVMSYKSVGDEFCTSSCNLLFSLSSTRTKFQPPQEKNKKENKDTCPFDIVSHCYSFCNKIRKLPKLFFLEFLGLNIFLTSLTLYPFS